MAIQVKVTSILAKADESIFDDKFSHAFIPEGYALSEAHSRACGGAKAASPILLLGQVE